MSSLRYKTLATRMRIIVISLSVKYSNKAVCFTVGANIKRGGGHQQLLGTHLQPSWLQVSIQPPLKTRIPVKLAFEDMKDYPHNQPQFSPYAYLGFQYHNNTGGGRINPSLWRDYMKYSKIYQRKTFLKTEKSTTILNLEVSINPS